MPTPQPVAHAPPRPTVAPWPELPLSAWADTYATLHMYTQIVGKLRLSLCAPTNQWWHVPLYVTARGLGTSPMPHDERTFELEFDFVDHALVLRTSDGAIRTLALVPRTVREFHAQLMSMLHGLGLDTPIREIPCEVPAPIPFSRDEAHGAYDAAMVSRWFAIVRKLDVIFKTFRGGFVGKASPVQFFWGSFDLAVTRFSGRPAPPRPDADPITRVAYDQEVSSLGFWPGGGGFDGPALYSYAAPEPEGFAAARARPAEARYAPTLKEFILPYEAVRLAADPAATVLDFATSTYELAASLGRWDRAALEARPWRSSNAPV